MQLFKAAMKMILLSCTTISTTEGGYWENCGPIRTLVKTSTVGCWLRQKNCSNQITNLSVSTEWRRRHPELTRMITHVMHYRNRTKIECVSPQWKTANNIEVSPFNYLQVYTYINICVDFCSCISCLYLTNNPY